LKDYLGQQLQSIPYFRALLRAVEARFYKELDFPGPTLELGCGDGHFASVAFDRRLEVGLDPWLGPVQEAAQREVYQMVTAGEGAHLPFPDGYFASAISNSVLEHIPDLNPVLAELNRVLQADAPFLFCVPNHRFLPTLSIGRGLDRMGFRRLGNRYRSFFNRISRHHNCDAYPVWKERLTEAGFVIEKWWYYFSPQALHVLEWGHYFGLPSWVSKKLTGNWIMVQTAWNLSLTRRMIEKHYRQAPEHDLGAYTFYVARKKPG
jgi:SAM-dependent methyltransferase